MLTLSLIHILREAKLMSRRTLLQASAALGASALVIGGAVAPGAMACADGAATEGGPGSTQYGFLVDLTTVSYTHLEHAL